MERILLLPEHSAASNLRSTSIFTKLQWLFARALARVVG